MLGRSEDKSHFCIEIWPGRQETWVQFLTPKLCDLGELLNFSELQFPANN